MINTTPALILFCKRPRLGFSKSRLAAEIGEAPAFAIARALLDCALEDVLAWHGPRIISPSDAEDGPWFQDIVSSLAAVSGPGDSDIDILPQSPGESLGGLGARLMTISTAVATQHSGPQIFIGSDSPAMTSDLLGRVAHSLESRDVVLADSADGGVTVMAARRPWPDIRDLPWSTDQLGAALSDRCRSLGLSVQHMPGGDDLDIQTDIPALLPALRADQRPARRALLSCLAPWADGLADELADGRTDGGHAHSPDTP